MTVRLRLCLYALTATVWVLTACELLLTGSVTALVAITMLLAGVTAVSSVLAALISPLVGCHRVWLEILQREQAMHRDTGRAEWDT